MENQNLWQLALSEFEESLSQANFKMWLRDTFIAEDTGETIVIGVPNLFYLDWIRKNFHKTISDTLRKFRPTIREISYKVAQKNPPPPVELESLPLSVAPTEPTPPPATQSEAITLPPLNQTEQPTPVTSSFQAAVSQEAAQAPQTGHTPLDPTRVFDNFIVGNANRLAHAVSLAAAQEPGKKYNPLFLYGGVGLGKTHLAHAIGNEILRQHPNFKITYVSCEVFTNEFIESLHRKDKNIESFKKRYRNTDVLLIDDIQFMSGKERTQEEFFHTFNALHQAKKQIVLTADQEPQNIPALEERLTSRFAWGMVADIQPPDFETRVAILREKCAERGYTIDNEVLDAIAQAIQSNIRELEGSLQRLVTEAQIKNIPVTIDLVTRLYGHLALSRGRSVSANRIIQTVSEFFEIKPDEVIGSRRFKELVYPRQLVMYLLRHELSFSYPKIGKELGGKDHTTIMHGVEKIEKELARNTNIQYDLTQLKDRLHKNS